MPSPADKLLDLAREAFKRDEWCYSPACLSGTDLAEAPVWGCIRRFYEAVADGEDVEEVIAREDAKWRAYAVEANAKVERAPKIQRGPYEGTSAIHHRWVSPDEFKHRAPHLRTMVELCKRRGVSAA